MKITTSVRSIYAEQFAINEKLKIQVDELLRPLAFRNRWHYESRIKLEQSFALKLESGRFSNPRAIEDFFACTLVVKNLSEILEAEREIRQKFRVAERRPSRASHTHKAADQFPFDDLRLFAHWKDDPALPPTGLDNIKFEVQIKTFLQHAWGIATHDLIYKTDDVSWSRQRIAYQIKAMLEHAEVSIQEADRLAETSSLAKTQRDTDKLNKVILIIKKNWLPENLPGDLRRLAENIANVMDLAKLSWQDLEVILNSEKQRQKGTLPVNVSPYAIVVQAVAWHRPDNLRSGLADTTAKKKVFVSAEMELPDWMSLASMVNVIRVSSTAIGEQL